MLMWMAGSSMVSCLGLHLVQQLLVVAALSCSADGLIQGYAVYCNPVA
jgi:hypothetical protein